MRQAKRNYEAQFRFGVKMESGLHKAEAQEDVTSLLDLLKDDPPILDR